VVRQSHLCDYREYRSRRYYGRTFSRRRAHPEYRRRVCPGRTSRREQIHEHFIFRR
jgi:hypothetical protein